MLGCVHGPQACSASCRISRSTSKAHRKIHPSSSHFTKALKYFGFFIQTFFSAVCVRTYINVDNLPASVPRGASFILNQLWLYFLKTFTGRQADLNPATGLTSVTLWVSFTGVLWAIHGSAWPARRRSLTDLWSREWG